MKRKLDIMSFIKDIDPIFVIGSLFLLYANYIVFRAVISFVKHCIAAL